MRDIGVYEHVGLVQHLPGDDVEHLSLIGDTSHTRQLVCGRRAALRRIFAVAHNKNRLSPSVSS